MKYISVNELSSFDFHDAVIASIDLSDKDMSWTVSAVNVAAQNTQNNYDVAMCVDSAKITFEDASVEKIEFSSYTVHQRDQLIEFHEAKTAKESEYSDILKKTLDGNYIYSLDDFSATNDDSFRACFNIESYADGNYCLTIGHTEKSKKH